MEQNVSALHQGAVFRAVVYLEKDPDANPYYYSPDRLRACAMAVRELLCTLEEQQAPARVQLTKLRGGHRLEGPYDTEIGLLAQLSCPQGEEAFAALLDRCCQRHKARWRREPYPDEPQRGEAAPAEQKS